MVGWEQSKTEDRQPAFHFLTLNKTIKRWSRTRDYSSQRLSKLFFRPRVTFVMETFIQVKSLLLESRFLTSQSEKLCGPKHWKTLGLFCIVVVMGGQGASQFSPLQVSLVKGRLGTFPNYSALYLKKKILMKRFLHGHWRLRRTGVKIKCFEGS